MAKIEIWPGSTTWTAGKTAFGFYDDDSDFQNDAPKIAKWCAQRLGYPLVDIELQDINFFSAFVSICFILAKDKCSRSATSRSVIEPFSYTEIKVQLYSSG